MSVQRCFKCLKRLATITVCVVLPVSIGHAASSSQAPDQEFRIVLAPGDTVKFDILDDDKDPIDLLISTEGVIQAPLLGAVNIAGLTLPAALEELNRRYIESEIFRKPKIGLSVAEFRPVFVIGDVQSPGSYPYQPQLTVEKAIGLAGGQIKAKPAEDPFLQRARIRGELSALKASIIAEGLAHARLNAQLDGRLKISDEDIPTMARPYMDESLARIYRDVELQILEADIEGFIKQRDNLEEGLKEAEHSLRLFEQLYKKLEKAVGFTKGDLERAKELQKRGIQTLSNVSNIERQLTNEEARMLQILTVISDERRGIGTLKRKLAGLEQSRKMNILSEMQQRNSRLAKIVFNRRIAEEQLVLLSTMSEQELAENKEVILDFMIRRTAGGETRVFSGSPDTLMAPGDVVTVRMLREGESRASANLEPAPLPSSDEEPDEPKSAFALPADAD